MPGPGTHLPGPAASVCPRRQRVRRCHWNSPTARCVAPEFIGTGIGMPVLCPLYGMRIPGESLAVTSGNRHKNRIGDQNGQINVRNRSTEPSAYDHFVSESRMSGVFPGAARGSRVCWPFRTNAHVNGGGAGCQGVGVLRLQRAAPRRGVPLASLLSIVGQSAQNW